MKPLKNLGQIWMLGNDSQLRIGEDPSEFFEKLWTREEGKPARAAGKENTRRRSLPSYRGHERVGVKNDFQDRRTLRIASLTALGLSPAQATAL